MKKNIKTRLLASVMTVAMVGSLCACGGGGYMTPVNNLMDAFNKKETDPMDMMMVMAPDFAAKEMESVIKSFMKMNDDMEDYLEEATEANEEMYEEIDDEYDKWKISFEEKKAEKIEKDDLEDLIDEYEDYYKDNMKSTVKSMEEALDDDDLLEDFADMLDIDEKDAKSLIKSMIKYMQVYEDLKITAGYEVKGKFILKSGKDTYETDTVKFVVLKINGSWVYMGLTDGSLHFEEDDDYLFSSFYSQLKYSSLDSDVMDMLY